MRKFLIAAGLTLMGLAFIPALSAGAASVNHPGDLPNGYHLKTDICHNVDHNPVVVHVSIDSTKASQETGHGLLVLNVTTHGFVSFDPHVGTGGHAHDFVLRVYIKHGNDEVNTYVSESKCEAPEVTTTTTQPPVTTTTTEPPTTTTTQPEVTTTTQPGVVTTTTQPAVTTTTQAPVVTTTTQAPAVVAPTTTTTAPVVAPVVTPAVPGAPLAETGAADSVLTSLGLGLLGLGLLLSGVLRKTPVRA